MTADYDDKTKIRNPFVEIGKFRNSAGPIQSKKEYKTSKKISKKEIYKYLEEELNDLSDS